MTAESNERVKMTLLLDEQSIKIIRKFSYETMGTTNVSKGIMEMAKQYEQQQQSKQGNS